MTDDMQSSFGIVDDGSTDKTIQKVQQFDKAISQAESSVGGLSQSLLSMDKIAEKSLSKAGQAASGGGLGGGLGDGRFRGASRAIQQLGGGIGGDIGRTVSQVGELGKKVELLGGNSSKAVLALGAAGIALAAISIGVQLWQGHLDKANKEITRSLGLHEDLARIIAQGSDVAAARVQQAQAEINIQIQARDEAQATADANKALNLDFLDLFTDANETAQAAADTASEVIKSEQEIIDALTDEFGPALDISTAEVEKAASALQQLAAQEANLRATRQQALDDQSFDRARRDSRAAEDAADADAERFDQRAEAASKDAASTAKIQSTATAQQTKTLKAANDAIIKTILDGNQARAKLQQEFSDRAIEDQNRFNERRAQAENDFGNAQFDAEQANDIIKALQAQRAFDEQQKLDQAAADKETQQRESEKQKRLQELRDEQSQRITEIRANLAIEIAAQKEALRMRLADNARASADRARQEAKADAKAAKARAKSQRRQAEDDALADERAERAFREQLKAIRDKRKAEQQALRAVFETLQQSGEATVRVIGEATTIVINATGQVVQQFLTGLASAAQGGSISAFAEGGIVTSPTLAILGENYKREAVIPLSSGGAMGFSGPSITINLTTADIATGEQVGQAIRGAMGQMAKVDIKVLSDSLAGVTQ